MDAQYQEGRYKPRVHVYLLAGVWSCATQSSSVRATSNTASNDNQDKINLWVSFSFLYREWSSSRRPFGSLGLRFNWKLKAIETRHIDLWRAIISTDNIDKRMGLSLYSFFVSIWFRGGNLFKFPSPPLHMGSIFPSPSPPLMSRLSPCTSSCQIKKNSRGILWEMLMSQFDRYINLNLGFSHADTMILRSIP